MLRPAPAVLALALASAVLAAGCAQPEEGGRTTVSATPAPTGTLSGSGTATWTGVPPEQRPDRPYWLLAIEGTVRQVPAHDGGGVAACGRPGGAFTAVDVANATVTVVRGHDIDWEATWLVATEHVEVQDDGSTCDLAWAYAAEGAFTWRWADAAVEVAQDGAGLRVGSAVLADGQSHTLGIDSAAPGKPAGTRYVGEVRFTAHGPWRLRDVVEVASESEVTGSAGFWANGRP